MFAIGTKVVDKECVYEGIVTKLLENDTFGFDVEVQLCVTSSIYVSSLLNISDYCLCTFKYKFDELEEVF